MSTVDFKKVIQEIEAVRNAIILTFVLLDTAFVFLAGYAILILFNFYPILAFIPALYYFISEAYKRITTKTLRDIEEKYPALREKLRTAADTADQENFMVLRLRLEVINLVRTVAMSSLIDLKKIAITVGKILGIAFIIIGISSYNIQIIDLKAAISNADLLGTLRDKLLRGHIPDSLLNSDVKSINENSAINDLANQQRLRKLLAQEQLEANLPEDIFKGTDKTFEETLSKKKRIYIRNYFSKVRYLE